MPNLTNVTGFTPSATLPAAGYTASVNAYIDSVPSTGQILYFNSDHPSISATSGFISSPNTHKIIKLPVNPNYFGQAFTANITISGPGINNTITLPLYVRNGTYPDSSAQGELVLPVQGATPIPTPQYNDTSSTLGYVDPYTTGPAFISPIIENGNTKVCGIFPSTDNRALSFGFLLPPDFNNLNAQYFVWSAQSSGNVVWTERGKSYLNGSPEAANPVYALPGTLYRTYMDLQSIFVGVLTDSANGQSVYLAMAREGQNPLDSNTGSIYIHYAVFEYTPLQGTAQGLIWAPANAMFCTEGVSTITNYGLLGLWKRVLPKGANTTLEFSFVMPADYGGNARVRVYAAGSNSNLDSNVNKTFADMSVSAARKIPCDTVQTTFLPTDSQFSQVNLKSSNAPYFEYSLGATIQPLDTVNVRIRRQNTLNDTSNQDLVVTAAYVLYNKSSFTQDMYLSVAAAQGSASSVLKIESNGTRRWANIMPPSLDSYVDFPLEQVPITYNSNAFIRIRWQSSVVTKGNVLLSADIGSNTPGSKYGNLIESSSIITTAYQGAQTLHETVIPVTQVIRRGDSLFLRVWRRGNHPTDTLIAPIDINEAIIEFTSL